MNPQFWAWGNSPPVSESSIQCPGFEGEGWPTLAKCFADFMEAFSEIEPDECIRLGPDLKPLGFDLAEYSLVIGVRTLETVEGIKRLAAKETHNGRTCPRKYVIGEIARWSMALNSIGVRVPRFVYAPHLFV